MLQVAGVSLAAPVAAVVVLAAWAKAVESGHQLVRGLDALPPSGESEDQGWACTCAWLSLSRHGMKLHGCVG